MERCHALIRRSNSKIRAFNICNRARGNAETGKIGQPFIIGISRNGEQLIDASAADRCDNAKLGKLRPDRIDHGVQL